MAAQEMNGKEINGRKVTTKGPSSQQSLTTTSSSALADADKTITDCYYYILNGTCKPKQGQKCMYRHMEKLRHTKQVCEKWHKKNCRNKNCPKLHPSQKHQQELANKKVQLDRCNSHNAFKCYGQCGKKECNTHFQTEGDLVDHVIKDNLKSTCEECNAVFFNAKEQASHQHTKHKQPIKTETENNMQAEPIGVFWDIENCQVPRGISALAIVQKIRKTFYPGRREVEFMCVCDTTKEKKDVLEELNRSQINIIHINATSKNAADDKVKQALRRFAQTHTPPATIVLISGDINFTSELSDLRHRNNLRVILLHNQQASDVLKQCAHECHRFKEFTAGLPLMNSISNDVNDPKEVIVSNLPSGNRQLKTKVSNQLKMLVDNTGGKIMHLQLTEDSKENTAFIRFADAEAARRAVTRLNNEEVFGSKIRVKLKKINKPALPTTPINSDNLKDNSSVNQFIDFAMNANFPPNQMVQAMPVLNQTFPRPLMAMNGIVPIPFPMPPPLAIQQRMASQLTPPNIPNPSDSGIDIYVQNLDASVNSKELKKQLVSLVREHCKVISVNIIGPNKTGNSHAFVKVSKLQDALQCISKLNSVVKKMKFSLASDKEDALKKIKTELYNLLFETPAQWMPLNEFLLAYKDKYKRAFHVLNLDQVKELVYVDGKPNAQFICLIQNPIGYRKIKQEPFLSKKVANILKIHNRRVPLSCLPGLYWSYTEQNFIFDESGEMLVKVVCNSDVSLAGNSPQSQIIFFKKPKPSKGDKYPLSDFKDDIVQLLKASPLFLIPFNKVAPLYHQYFGRQLCLVDFGYKDLNEILSALPEILEIFEQKDSKTVTFTKPFKKTILEGLLQQLLKARDKQKLPLTSLLTAYYRFFGCKLYYRNFGHSSFLSLVSSLDQMFRVCGVGDGKVLMLANKVVKPNKRVLKKFADEVAILIQSKPNKQLSVHNLSSEFFRYYGRQLKLAELGFSKLTDLVSAISDYIEIRGDQEQKILYMSDENANFDNVWSEIEIILNKSPDLCILGLLLPTLYQEKLKRQFPIDVKMLNQLFKNSPPSVSIVGKNSHRLLVYNNPADYPSVMFSEQLCQLAYTCQYFKVTIQTLQEKLREKGIKSTFERIEREIKKSDKFQIVNETTYQLNPQESQRLFECDIIQILYNEPDHKLLLNHFAKTYTKNFSKVLRVSDYGVSKLMHLIDKLTNGFVEVEHPTAGGQPTMSLGKLGKLCCDCDTVMEDNDGSILLCNFAPEYQRKFGKMLRPNDYGFPKVCELVECFSCVLKVYGEKNMKVVVQKKRILNPKFEETSDARATTMSSGSESDSDVIIESEEYVVKETNANSSFQNTDLLQFNSDDHKQVDYEWWMDSIPNLPEPALQPEPTSNLEFNLDLISFTEFDNNEIRSGGIDEDTLPQPLSPTATFYSSFHSMKARNKSSSDDFVDHLFTAIPTPQEPDLMRMLVGRCSPVDGLFAAKPLVTEHQSSTGSSISDTYSIFSPLKSATGQQQGALSPNLPGVSYSQLLGDVFNDQRNFGSPHRVIRPKLAANFSKQT